MCDSMSIHLDTAPASDRWRELVKQYRALHALHDYTHSVLTAIFPRESGLAGCPPNSPSPFIPELRILLGQA